MQSPSEKDGEQGKSFWRWLWRPRSRWLLGIPIGGFVLFVLGAAALVGGNEVIELFNTEQFCISCHEMRQVVYPEWQKSSHYKNAYGVRAACPDCHVPPHYPQKIFWKAAASVELIYKVLGTVDTPEKFKAHRLELAKQVWANMKADDSRECRKCHSLAAMALDKQSKRAARRHNPAYMKREGKTCIDCHKGIVHELPENF